VGAEDGGALPPPKKYPLRAGPIRWGRYSAPTCPPYDPSPSEATNLAPCARSITLRNDALAVGGWRGFF